MPTDHSHVMGIVFKILRSTIFITLFTILEYSYYLLDNVVTNSLSLINAFQCVFHHLKITIVVREGENETHAFNGEFHEKMEVQIGLVMKNHDRILLSCFDHQPLLLKSLTPKKPHLNSYISAL